MRFLSRVKAARRERSTANVKNQILEYMTRSMRSRRGKLFAFSGAYKEEEEFDRLTISFLKAERYVEAERRGRQLIHFILTHHDKLDILAPVIDDLNLFELYWKYDHPSQRLHFCHVINVFLLGLYIYHNFEPLREHIRVEMERTTPAIETATRPFFRFSGGNEYGEFLYRWRMAALCHDIGTGIQLCCGKKDEIKRCLEQMPFEKNIDSLEGIWKFDGKNLLEELDSVVSETRISEYMAYEENHPFKHTVYHDHGIISALIFLRLMHEGYARHSKNMISRTRFGEVVWYPEILSHSILEIAAAIAVHNLDQHSEALEKCAKNIRIYDLHKHTLSWLLKIADILQEWDKPKVDDSMNTLPPTNLKLDFSHSKISVGNFPREKRDQVLSVLQRYFDPNDIVTI